MLQALGCHLPPASTDDTQNVATAAIRVQWRTMAVTGHPLCASVMAALEGTERTLFPKCDGKYQRDYANHQSRRRSLD
jgi:hypothetical protein